MTTGDEKYRTHWSKLTKRGYKITDYAETKI